MLLLVPLAVTAGVFVLGRRPGRRGLAALVERPAIGVETVTGRPAWSSAGVQLGLWALIVAAVGFFWDVAWHIDLGRDQELFTPPHTAIVAGLVGLLLAGTVSTVLASVEEAPVRLRIGRLRVPWGALGLIVLGSFATAGFPLDALWHATYGVDVTMWSPTHLMMIGGAAFAPLAVWLLYREGGATVGRPWVRRVAVPMLVGALAVALAAFQLEFDDGVPQWQALYQPVLVALAATFALTVARVAVGPGWAALGALSFLAVRGLLTLLVGGALGHVVTRFPLYLGIALCVEAGFWVARRRSPAVRALLAGALAGTAGLATEWGWSHLWSYQPWQPRLLASLWVASAAALAGAVLGAAVGGVLSAGRLRLPAAVIAGAATLALVCLAVPFPRTTAPVTATVTATEVGAPAPTIDRFGRASLLRSVVVDVDASPAEAVRDADVLRVIAWQGGGRDAVPLDEVSPGHWRTRQAVPTGGSWKTLVLLLRGDVVMASPVAMPDDPEYGQAAIPLGQGRTEAMVPASSLLMRESHTGTALPQMLAYGGLGLEMVLWLVVVTAGMVAVGRRGAPPPPAAVSAPAARAAAAG